MTTPICSGVTVNGERIAAASIAAEAQNHGAPPGKPGWAWRKAARALAIRTLLLQEAKRRGLRARPLSLGSGRRETDEDALIRCLLDAEVTPARVTEAAIRATYETNPDRFRSPALFEPAHILFAAREDDASAREAARKRALIALDLIKRDPASFDRLAREESACPSRTAGGRLGQITAGDTVPEFETILQVLRPGELANELVETRYGFHVVRLDARANGTPLPYDVVRPHIAEALEKTEWARSAQQLVRRLAADSDFDGVDF